MRVLPIAVPVLTALFFFMMEACADKDTYRADHGVAPCEITAGLDSIFSGLIADNEPGAIVTVMRGDSIVYNHAYGLARLDTMERVTDSTVFNVSSSSKTVTAVAIMQLVERGLLSLDDSLSKFFPEFPARFFDKIKIRHVLNHTSGLPDLRPRTRAEWKEYLRKHHSVFGYESDYRLYGSEQEFMQSFTELDTVVSEPGTQYDPRDISYVLIAPLVERVTAMSFPQWVRRNIFDVVDMDESFYYTPGLRVSRLAHGYRAADHTEPAGGFISADGRWEEFDYQEANYFLTKADRGLCTSSRDFLKFKHALARGMFISEESLNEILQPTVMTTLEKTYYGVGAPVVMDSTRAVKTYHLNNNGGFTTIEAWWPDDDVQYVIFMARNDLPRYDIMVATDSVLQAAGWINR